MDGGDDRTTHVHVDAAGIGVGGGLVLRIEQRLECGIGAARLETGRHADAGEQTAGAKTLALGDQLAVVGTPEHLLDHRVIIAAVVGRAAWNEVRKFVGADEVAAPHLQAIETAMAGDLVDGPFDRVIGG